MAISYQFLINWNDDADNSDTYEDVSAYCLDAEWMLGDTDAYSYVSPPGWCRLFLDNTSERFAPEISSGDIRAGKVLTIKSYDGVTTRTHWTGNIWKIDVTGGYHNPRRATVQAYTWDAVLDQQNVTLPIQIEQRANQVIDAFLPALRSRYDVLDGYLVIGITGRNIIGTHKLFGDQPMTYSLNTGRLVWTYLGDTYAAGTRARAVMEDLTQAEIGRWAVDRLGVGQWKNRFWQMIDTVPDSSVSTGIDLHYNQGEHIKNRVEIDISPREIGDADSVLWSIASYQAVAGAAEIYITARFRDADNRPCGALEVNELEYGVDYTVNTQANGLGDAVAAEGVRIEIDAATGASAAKLRIQNLTAITVYFHDLQVRGTPIIFGDPVRIEGLDRWSITRYGSRLLGVRSAAVQDIDTAQYWADFQRVRRNTEARLLGLTITPKENATPALARGIFDRVTVTDAALAHTADYFIIGEHHKKTPTKHIINWHLVYADDQTFFIVGVDLIGGDHVLA